MGGKNFIFIETEVDFTWKIRNEKKNIQGFTCNKATTTKYVRNFTAWFTTEIPIVDGPYKFFGLPGLILEVYDDAQNYHFQLVKYNPSDNSTI
ncbi:GLPGLI family protein [Chryseobacterium sp. H3056]|uniref:GLPGLI family protein n=1 Tax=Kaistella daneshvariae TaxID=2487074 RepID=A0A3N0WYB9_9FLAO|nr:GLPGLI family protein [Kaistella daneshvariae]